MGKSSRCHIIPPGENRCVWMTAGVLLYRLCDREFRCEECPLDSAIRGQVCIPEGSVREAPMPQSARPEPALRKELHYSCNHCWTMDAGPQRLRVGIEPGLSRAIGSPKAIVLPSRGLSLRAGQVCTWIVVSGGTLALEAPIGGVVRGANTMLTDRPHLLFEAPYDEGWLYEVETDDEALRAAKLMTPEETGDKYAADEARLLVSLNSMIRNGHHGVGLTLADGGQRLQSIADLVGATRYFNAVRHVYL